MIIELAKLSGDIDMIENEETWREDFKNGTRLTGKMVESKKWIKKLVKATTETTEK